MGVFLGLLIALVLHVGFVLFGGLIVGTRNEDGRVIRDVELVSDENVAAAKEKEPEKEEPKPEPKEDDEELEAEEEQVPDAEEIIRTLEISAAANAPALEAASLSAIEAALSGAGGGGDFADALSFSSGGRIGVMAKANVLEATAENAFSLDEIDQKPRAVFQNEPVYPAAMRGKKVEGVVTCIFVVDAAGKVTTPQVAKSSNPAFDKPALDALKRWKFEPAVKGGQRVACKMRVPIRFPAK